MKSYQIGTELVLATTFVDPTSGEAVNPTTVALRLLGPDLVEHDIPVSNPATGLYKAIYTPAVAGVWSIRWEGTGVVAAAAEYKFEIRPSAFA